MTWVIRVSLALTIFISALGASPVDATPLDVPPIYAALHARCGEPTQACCSVGPACDASGSVCTPNGVCSVPLVGVEGACIAPKAGEATAQAGFCGPGLNCVIPASASQGKCIPCGGLGEDCCMGYSQFCDSGLSCTSTLSVCLPVAAAEGQRCDFKTPCQSGLLCSDPAGGTCQRCGAEFAGCCANGGCNAGLLCSGGTVCLTPPTLNTVTCSNGVLAPSLAQCPVSRTDEIRVLNYNVQLWPEKYAIASFMDFAEGHWPQTDRRARQIGRALGDALTSRDGGFEIIALQEAWSPDRRSIIVDAAEQQAQANGVRPHPLIRGGKAIYDVTFGPEQDRLSPYHKLVVGGAALGGFAAGVVLCAPLGPVAFICGVAGGAAGDALASGALSEGDVINSGLMVMSRFPIVSTDLHVYEAESGVDEFARKGVVHALVFRGRNPRDFLHVFATHLQNKDEAAIKKQILELQDFIQAKTFTDPFPILVLGDFNVDGNNPQDPTKSSPLYRDELRPKLTTSSIDPQLQDVWPLVRGNQDGATSDGGKRLDYVFASRLAKDGTGLSARAIDVLPFTTSSSIGQAHPVAGAPTLSDHLGVAARFTWTPPTFASAVDPGVTRFSVGVAVNRLFAVSRDSCDDMEFYGRVDVIGGSSISPAQVFDGHITEGNDVRVTTMAEISIFPAGTRTVRANIEVLEDDDLPCGQGDDNVDINPFSGRTTLELLIDIENLSVHLVDRNGNRVNPPIGSVGGIGRAVGNGDDMETAEVTFSVKLNPVP